MRRESYKKHDRDHRVRYSKDMGLTSRKRQRITAPLWFDGRFGETGTYTSINGNFSGTYPRPYTSAQYVPSVQSHVVTYTAATKQQSWWPDPYTPWSPIAGAFNSYNNETQTTARAQLLGGWAYRTGDEFYVSWTVNVPSANGTAWPNYLADSDWNLLGQFHGAPWNGSPIIQINILNFGGELRLSGGDGSGYSMWSHPLTLDRWMRITMHVIISSIGGQGLLEVWVDGQRKSLALPHSRSNYSLANQYLSPDGLTAHIATELADSAGTGTVYMNSYRKGIGSKFGTGTMTFFHAGLKIGPSYHSVQ